MFCSWYSRVLVLEEPDLPLELTQLLRLLLAGLHSALIELSSLTALSQLVDLRERSLITSYYRVGGGF